MENLVQRISSRATPIPSALVFASWYDFMNSLLSPEAVVAWAAQAGCRAVALCDPNLHGMMEFFRAARTAGLKPIFGARIGTAREKNLVFVKDAKGYKNLCALLSDGATRISEEQSEGLLKIPASAVPIIRIPSKAFAPALRMVRSIRTGTLLNTPHALKFDALPVSGPEVLDYLSKNPAARRLLEIISSECVFIPETGHLHFPAYIPPGGVSPRTFLAKLAREGLQRRYGSNAAQHLPQLETELRMIFEVGYEEYFLTVWDLLQRCAERGIEWITRGSAADSLVCYSLGISNVCPFRFELYFQRFLNPDRMRMRKLPDIDLDFPHDRKDEVVRLVFESHPPGHVAAVGGFNTFQARSAIAEIAKTLGMPESHVRRLTANFPVHARADQAVESAQNTLAAAEGLFEEEPAATALRMAYLLDGMPRHRKIHPCGLVLARRPIREFCPVFLSEKGWEATHFDMDAVEEAGLVKMDILAQGGLAVMRDARAMIRASKPEAPTHPPPGWNDPKVWEMIAKGRARGVHHIESPAMTTLEKMCDCRDIDTLVAIVSVIRPGAANTMRKAIFARRARGLEQPHYAHPSLEPILRLTHGVIAYEEHILQICEAFAGMSAGRADILRRALVKNREKEIEAMRAEFYENARAAGRSQSSIEEVWKLVDGFRGYAFCRAHSTAYALEAYEAAWLKVHYPAEFLAAVLTHEKGFYSPLVYTLECRLLGIDILRPDINLSVRGYSPESMPGGQIGLRVPLWKIKGLPDSLPDRILAEREQRGPFASLPDFFHRVEAPPEAMRLLLRAGAFDGFGLPRTELFWRLLRLEKSGMRGQSLFESAEESPPRLHGITEPDLQARLRDEWELLGFCVSAHPLESFPDVAWETYCPVAEAGKFEGKTITVCGLIVAARDHFQRDGRLMRFFTLCDFSGMIECELFADAGARFRLETIRYPVVQIVARVETFEGGGGWTLRVKSVSRPAVRKKSALPATTSSLLGAKKSGKNH